MSYIRNRLIQAGVTLTGVISVSFVLLYMMPGGPVEFLRQDIRNDPQRYGLNPNPSEEEINAVISRLINVPAEETLHESFFAYFSGIVQGDFGNAILIDGGAPVLQIIVERAPWTIFLSSIGLVWGLLAGIILGSFMAYYEGSKFDVGATVSMIFAGAIPYYLIAIFLLYYMGFQWGWFPTGGRMDPNTTPGMNWPWIEGVLRYAALPSLSFIIPGFGGFALALRANSIRLIGSDHIRVAELRGLTKYRIATAYLAHNAILPMYTGIVVGLGGLLGGSIILEVIFNYRGMGMLMYDAVRANDWPVMMGVLIIVTTIFVIGTLIADLTYSLVDPRTDLRGME